MHSYAYSCPGLPGDLLLFSRPAGYQHYAVNVGNGYIVHVSSNDDFACTNFNEVRAGIGSFSSTNGSIAIVKKEPYANFVQPGDKVTVESNKEWRGRTALQRMEIVGRALSKVGKEGYNLLFKNCEHFARWCRYGEEKSEQAENFGIGVGVAAGAALVAVGLGLGAYYLLSNSDEEKERNQRYKRQ